jgi:chaperonin cofactor prefoldin
MELSVEAFNQLLEEELENSFEVKDRKALHRSVLLLSEHVVSKEKHDTALDRVEVQFQELKSDVRIIAETMQQGFAAMERRFEAVDKRFENIQTQMDRRFDAVDKRFEDWNQRFEDLQNQMDTRFNAVDKRFDDVNKRFEDSNQRFGDFQLSLRRMFTFMSIGFIVMGVLMSVYEFIR